MIPVNKSNVVKHTSVSLLVCFVLLSFVQVARAAPARSWVSTQAPKQGDVVAIKILDPKLLPTETSFMGSPVPFAPYGAGYIGFLAIGPTVLPGAYPFTATLGDGTKMLRTVWVTKRKFPYVDLGIPSEVGVTPEELVTKLATEKKHLDVVLGVTSTLPAFRESFISPFATAVKNTSVFGEIRKTGKQEIRHLGVDYGAPVGTPVRSLNAGTVSDSYVDTIYGNSVIIDHGQGVFSLYLHLNTVAVKRGDTVARGGPIGTVGKTGYATGPHLHLSVKIRGVAVDPFSLIRLPL